MQNLIAKAQESIRNTWQKEDIIRDPQVRRPASITSAGLGDPDKGKKDRAEKDPIALKQDFQLSEPGCDGSGPQVVIIRISRNNTNQGQHGEMVNISFRYENNIFAKKSRSMYVSLIEKQSFSEITQKRSSISFLQDGYYCISLVGFVLGKGRNKYTHHWLRYACVYREKGLKDQCIWFRLSYAV